MMLCVDKTTVGRLTREPDALAPSATPAYFWAVGATPGTRAPPFTAPRRTARRACAAVGTPPLSAAEEQAARTMALPEQRAPAARTARSVRYAPAARATGLMHLRRSGERKGFANSR